VNESEHAAPPDALEKAVKRIGGPPDDQRLSFDLPERDKPPESTVLAVVPIVSHHENMTIGNDNLIIIGELVSEASTSCESTVGHVSKLGRQDFDMSRY